MPDPVDVHVGGQVRALRIAKGMSQTDLANRLVLSFQQVQKYESGANRISASKLFKLSQILSVEPARFFEGLSRRKAAAPESLSSLKSGRVALLYDSIPNDDTRESLYRLMKAISVTQKKKKPGRKPGPAPKRKK